MILKASKKLLLMILVLALVLGLMPMSASAATGTMIIGGQTVSDLGTSQGNLSTDGWAWDESSNTITLNSNYTGGYIDINCAQADTIKLEYSGDVEIVGIFCFGSLEISGSNGTLTATGTNITCGIRAENITISGGTVEATGYYYGILSAGSTTIFGGTVTATGGERGIYSSGGSTIISGGADVTATGTGSNGTGILSVTDTKIENATVKATGCMAGMSSSGSTTISGGADVTASGTDTFWGNGASGIYSYSNIIISGGKIDATGYYSGIRSGWGDTKISGGTITAEGGKFETRT